MKKRNAGKMKLKFTYKSKHVFVLVYDFKKE